MPAKSKKTTKKYVIFGKVYTLQEGRTGGSHVKPKCICIYFLLEYSEFEEIFLG